MGASVHKLEPHNAIRTSTRMSHSSWVVTNFVTAKVPQVLIIIIRKTVNNSFPSNRKVVRLVLGRLVKRSYRQVRNRVILIPSRRRKKRIKSTWSETSTLMLKNSLFGRNQPSTVTCYCWIRTTMELAHKSIKAPHLRQVTSSQCASQAPWVPSFLEKEKGIRLNPRLVSPGSHTSAFRSIRVPKFLVRENNKELH